MRHLLCATLLCFSNHAGAFELSGAIRSNGAPLPQAISIVAERMHGEPQIHGTVENSRYRIDVPENTLLALVVRAPQWEAEPKLIFSAATAGALDFLLYPAAVPEAVLAAELQTMEQEDQALRAALPPTGPDLATRQRMLATDKAREQRLRQIIASKGWPTQTMVGYKAAGSAWLIAQHGSEEFLKSSLPLMRAAAAWGEITPSKLALTIDRDLCNGHQPQLYGSQFRTDSTGKTVPFPIDDPQQLEQRRASMGMEPYAQYRQAFE
nr:DUF6624 domain-containing protein [uncultured Janthinobacterium sp.]